MNDFMQESATVFFYFILLPASWKCVETSAASPSKLTGWQSGL